MENRRSVGTEYERKAAAYLEALGYRIVERNFRCRTGEIDLIAWDRRVLVFLEVKYRKTGSFGSPAEAVTPAKQRTICRVADYYRIRKGLSENQNCRFDVVSILGEQIQLIRDAFQYH